MSLASSTVPTPSSVFGPLREEEDDEEEDEDDRRQEYTGTSPEEQLNINRDVIPEGAES